MPRCKLNKLHPTRSFWHAKDLLNYTSHFDIDLNGAVPLSTSNLRLTRLDMFVIFIVFFDETNKTGHLFLVNLDLATAQLNVVGSGHLSI